MVRTLGDAYLDLRGQLKARGVAGYQLEARELVCHVMGIGKSEFDQKKGLLVFQKEAEELERLLALRLSGTPIQHITGMWEFYSLDMHVSPDTLVPRPDTEKLAECAIGFLESRSRGRILDLCCGGGCIGVAVLKNSADTFTGVFCDNSEKALHVARKNIMLHALTARALTVRSDVRSPGGEMSGKYNLIVCNPPYIPSGDIDTLDEEVRREPREALDGGIDGLDFYRVIAKNYRPALTRGGALMFEVGINQHWDVTKILEEQRYKNVRCETDLSGIERVVWGTAD